MEPQMIPSSPTVENPDILACAPDNTIIYGVRKHLVVIKPTAEENKPEDIHVIGFKGFSNFLNILDYTISSININPNWGKPNKYAVISVNEFIRYEVIVWDIETGQKVCSHSKHSTIKEDENVMGGSNVIGASFSGEEIIISASVKGTIISYNLIRDECTILADLLVNRKKKRKLFYTRFSICPHANWLSAFGRNDGLITVVDLRNSGTILYNLTGHDQAVFSFSWCPVPVNIFNKIVERKLHIESNEFVLEADTDQEQKNFYASSQTAIMDSAVKDLASEKTSLKVDESTKIEKVEQKEPKEEYLLASSSRESSGESKIIIWHVGTDDGRLQTFLTLPADSSEDSASSEDAEDLIKSWSDVFNTEIFGGKLLPPPLCWAAPTILLASSASGELLQLNIPKPTIDEQPNYVTLHTKHWDILFCIKCPSFYFDEYNFKLKFDNINVWTAGREGILCNFNMKNKTIQNLYNYNAERNKVKCTVGHYIDPNTITMGTDIRNAYVQLWNFSNHNQKIQEFKALPILKWDSSYQNFAGVTALAWHPTIDGVLAWGTGDGTIGVKEVFTEKASKRVHVNYFKDEIQKLEWGPDAKEEKFLLFAVGKGSVGIFDMDALNNAPQIITLPGTICTMAWKPDFRTLLISTCVESFFKFTPKLTDPELCHTGFRLEKIVWHSDAAEKRPEHYSKYSQVFAAVSKDTILKIVDLSVREEQTNKLVIAQFSLCNIKKITAVQWNPSKKNYLVAVSSYGAVFVLDIETETIISTYISPLHDVSYHVYWSPANENLIVLFGPFMIHIYSYLDYPAMTETDGIETAISRRYIDRSKVVPLFYTIKEANFVKDLTNLLDWKLGSSIEKDVNSSNSSSINILDVFGDQENLSKIFDKNFKFFKNNMRNKESNTLELIQGNVSLNNIETAIKKRRVTPSVIAMSLMISRNNLSKRACEMYADQLLKNEFANPLEVLNYLLICDRVAEALNYLCRKKMFCEAFLLVKSRFGSGSELTKDVLAKWSKNLIEQENYEFAVCCCICTEDYKTAAEILYRRNNLEILHIALRLAKLCGNTSFCEEVEIKLNHLQMEEDKKKEN